MDAAAGAAAGAMGGGPPTLTFQQNLQWFRPRFERGEPAGAGRGAGLRLHDRRRRGHADRPQDRHGEDQGRGPGSRSSWPTRSPACRSRSPRCRTSPACPSLGIFPSTKARVIVDRPADWGSPTSSAVDEMSNGLAETIASTVLEAEGYCYGDPGVQAGEKIVIEGVAEEFAGEWIVTSASHIFVPAEGGYATRFEVSGRHEPHAARPDDDGRQHVDARRGCTATSSASSPTTTTRTRSVGSRSASPGWRPTTRATGPAACSRRWARSGATCSSPRSATRCSSASSSATPAVRTSWAG